MLSLHLLQVSLVYVNTLMIQEVLKEREWLGRLTAAEPPGAVAAEVATHQSLWNLRPQYERTPAVRVGHGIPRRYFAGFSTFAG
jgi:hypothetical protein